MMTTLVIKIKKRKDFNGRLNLVGSKRKILCVYICIRINFVTHSC